MRDDVHCREMSRNRNMSAEEETMTNDFGHHIGCDCYGCRPDMHEIEAAEAARKEAA